MATIWYPRVVYCLKNKVNNKCYVGSAFDLEKRSYEHFRALKKGKHPCVLLQNEFNTTNGIEDFEIFILEHIACFDERYKEKEWQARLKTYDPQYGYNTKDPYWRCGAPGGEDTQ